MKGLCWNPFNLSCHNEIKIKLQTGLLWPWTHDSKTSRYLQWIVNSLCIRYRQLYVVNYTRYRVTMEVMTDRQTDNVITGTIGLLYSQCGSLINRCFFSLDQPSAKNWNINDEKYLSYRVAIDNTYRKA